MALNRPFLSHPSLSAVLIGNWTRFETKEQGSLEMAYLRTAITEGTRLINHVSPDWEVNNNCFILGEVAKRK